MFLKLKDVPGLSRFNWDDPLFLEQQLNEEERMMRDAARTFAQEKLQPRVIEAYANETMETKIFREMGEMGTVRINHLARQRAGY